MRYEELLGNISRHDKFEIVEEKYEEAFFGNFQILVCFSDGLVIEINQDRGLVDIYINYSSTFKKQQIPLWFALDCMEAREIRLPTPLDSLEKAQGFLFNHVPDLQRMMEKALLSEISRRWSRWKAQVNG